MPLFVIQYGLGGGFSGGQIREVIHAQNESEALNTAEEKADQEYQSFEGLHGIRSLDEIFEEENVDDHDATMIYNEEKESWLHFEAWPIEQVPVEDRPERIGWSRPRNSNIDNRRDYYQGWILPEYANSSVQDSQSIEHNTNERSPWQTDLHQQNDTDSNTSDIGNERSHHSRRGWSVHKKLNKGWTV